MRWIEHIDNGDGTPVCDKNKSNRDVVNDFFCDVDPDKICKECKRELARMLVNNFDEFRSALESSCEFRMFKTGNQRKTKWKNRS